MLAGRIVAIAHCKNVRLEGFECRVRIVHEVLHETRRAAQGDPEHVVKDEYLAVDRRASADAYDG